ncbi:TetR/AcrR family transcriptional regulator C-terminal domain-containing protein [Amycolatopsis thermoflava]|uniref:TetR/AcrR family transcriptional regulator C-terminal domain-containing protein n=1 Tax=Amycolatopsis TaxID=1813 RepID=UPI0036513ACA
MSTKPKDSDRGTLAALRGGKLVRAALDQVNDGGLESLTMRRLAERLGTHLPTIYRLYADKDALLDDMAEAILARALASRDPADTDWDARTRRLATGLRAALLAQRDGARIVGGNYAAKRNNLSFVDTLVGCMRDSGLPGEPALWAASTVFCFVLGEALEQQGASGDEVGVLLDAVSAGGYHHLAASPVQHLFDFDARFAFGLELLLGGVRRYTA